MTKDQVIDICNKYGITNYTIHDDMSISVDGDVNMSNPLVIEAFCKEASNDSLVKIPLKFREVSGRFDVSYNRLLSLEGCPEIVGGEFYCHVNNLTSLEFGPRKCHSFSCSNNLLTSLKYSPTEVASYYCNGNRLTSLEFSPKSKYMDCGENVITSLVHFNSELARCPGNKITSFDGLPENFEHFIDITGNPIYEVINLLLVNHRSVDRMVDAISYLREFDVIQGHKVIRDRLEEAHVHMGLEMPKDIILKEYILV